MAGELLRGEAGAEPKKPPEVALAPAVCPVGLSPPDALVWFAAGSYWPKKLLEDLLSVVRGAGLLTAKRSTLTHLVFWTGWLTQFYC